MFNLTSEYSEMCLISKRISDSAAADKGHKVLFGKICMMHQSDKGFVKSMLNVTLVDGGFPSTFCHSFAVLSGFYIFSRLHLQKKVISAKVWRAQLVVGLQGHKKVCQMKVMSRLR